MVMIESPKAKVYMVSPDGIRGTFFSLKFRFNVGWKSDLIASTQVLKF